jgi:hypothetical protein
MDERVPGWVRVVVAIVLMAPQLLVGAWGLLATKNWYENFPGFGPDLVASFPPFNEHLAADAGGGFFATGVALLIAVIWPRRDLMLMALVTFLAFALPHTIYHSLNNAPGLQGGEEIANSVNLWFQVLVGLACTWGAWRGRTEPSAAPS